MHATEAVVVLVLPCLHCGADPSMPCLLVGAACSNCCTLHTQPCVYVSNATRDDKASEASEAIKQQLLATFGATTAGVAVLDGLRTVAAGVIAGTSFIITGNLAAPYAGGMATEVRCYWLVGPSKYLPALSAAVQPALLKTQLAV